MFQICRVMSVRDPGFLPLLSQFLVEWQGPSPDAAALGRLEQAVKQDRIRYYMALEEGRGAVGVVSLTFGFMTLQLQPMALLGDLYVHPGHRGRGAAAALLLAAMDAAHEARCGMVVTASAENMEGIFERYGWKRRNLAMAYEVDLLGPPPSITITGDVKFD
jgi:GNAT superfamily N-acetyltransferase